MAGEKNFDDLVLTAVDNPAKGNLELLQRALAAEAELAPGSAEAFAMLWEVLAKQSITPEIARLAYTFAGKTSDEPGAVFRKLLCDSARLMLPRDQGHSPVMRAIGARNDKMPVREIAARLERLFALKSGVVIFLPGSGRWGAVSTIDSVNGSVVLGAFRGNGSMISVPLESVLGEALVFAADPDLSQVMDPGTAAPIPSARFRDIITRRAKLPVSAMQMRAIALAGCARKLSEASFNTWWNTTAPVQSSGKRRACEGRNLQEMALLIEAEREGAQAFADDEYAAFAAFFTRLKPEIARREVKNLATILAAMSERAEAGKFAQCIAPLAGKAIFWPANPGAVPLADLAIWGELPAKVLTNLGTATILARGEEYLAALLLKLPLKALNSLTSLIDPLDLENSISERHSCSADLLCWIWRNRKKPDMETLDKLINIENVVRVLSVGELPKEWSAAVRELRALLMDKADFQAELIDRSREDLRLFAATLCGALFLSSSERQSLLVKLSRVSPELQACLEGGAARQILSAGIGNRDKTPEVPAGNEPFFTSIRSHRRLIAELEDLINKQIPENREAIKVARAHGDFRENSEFDAAKERRRHLNRRRSELERDLAMIQPMQMKNVVVEDTAVIGSEVEITYSDGAKQSCYLLGAWDGDPDRKMLSYRTKLGRALLNLRVGESFQLDDRNGKISAVRALPAELAAELDD